VSLTGCFYVDPINERPSAEIVRDNIDLPFRGDLAQVHARFDDPDGDPVRLSWRAQACSLGGLECDANPFVTGTEVSFALQVPTGRELGAPTEAVRISLDVADVHGAIARPEQQLVLDVQDHAPTLRLQRDGRNLGDHFPVTVPIRVSAAFADQDVSDAVSLTWQLFPAAGSLPTPDRWKVWPDPAPAGTEAYWLLPDIDGLWTVRVTARDHQGAETSQDLPILVTADQPPCLGALDPGAADATIIVDAPRRFSVLTVDDDINVYPAPSANDRFLRAAHFAWSVASPDTGGALASVIGLDQHDLVIDPANYRPGDQLDVRVEISDALPRVLPCDPALASCSIDGSACRQRQTWHLEIR
jgi:hypothetical protein